MGYLIKSILLLLFTSYYLILRKFHFVKCGKGCRFEGLLNIPQRGGVISLGDNVYFTRFIELSVTKGAVVNIGNDTFIGPGTVLSCHSKITIGDHTIIGEYVSIHDNDHIFEDLETPIASQGFHSQEISIGRDVWIGCKAVILKGVTIGDHSVVGAGSVVTKDVPPGAVVAGVPAAVIRTRQPSTLLNV